MLKDHLGQLAVVPKDDLEGLLENDRASLQVVEVLNDGFLHPTQRILPAAVERLEQAFDAFLVVERVNGRVFALLLELLDFVDERDNRVEAVVVGELCGDEIFRRVLEQRLVLHQLARGDLALCQDVDYQVVVVQQEECLFLLVGDRIGEAL